MTCRVLFCRSRPHQGPLHALSVHWASIQTDGCQRCLLAVMTLRQSGGDSSPLCWTKQLTSNLFFFLASHVCPCFVVLSRRVCCCCRDDGDFDGCEQLKRYLEEAAGDGIHYVWIDASCMDVSSTSCCIPAWDVGRSVWSAIVCSFKRDHLKQRKIANIIHVYIYSVFQSVSGHMFAAAAGALDNLFRCWRGARVALELVCNAAIYIYWSATRYERKPRSAFGRMSGQPPAFVA